MKFNDFSNFATYYGLFLFFQIAHPMSFNSNCKYAFFTFLLVIDGLYLLFDVIYIVLLFSEKY
ncbi:hypothetical protein BEH94_06810 [Candidatus Altiarchaeales archaeon WOR_SM1_SCG]|nr:hypothetical protein BEH94_06810 [Candidatus Altiarchaeales archaeon WOR_SM1_SCG]